MTDRGLGSLACLYSGGPDFGVTNWLLNLPPLVLAALALVIGRAGIGKAGARLAASM